MSFPTVGIIGAGQIARLMTAPAIALGVRLKVLAASMDDPAAQVIPDVTVGDFQDLATLRTFARDADVVTVGQVDIPIGLLLTLEVEGVRVHPSTKTISAAQDLTEVGSALTQDVTGCEIAVHVARSPHGQAAVWAVTEIASEKGTRLETITPSPSLKDGVCAQAQRVALELAGSVSLVGVMTVQLLVVGEEVLVQGLVLGPDKSGYWSIDGSITSVFEQHLRAILDLPLGSTDLLAPVVVSAGVFGTDKTDLYRPYLHVFARDPGVKVHQYREIFRSSRNLGHVTVIGSNTAELRQRAAHAADYISGVIDE
jgi:5-(carboxyamino)imidazole ribonucleotide synthase